MTHVTEYPLEFENLGAGYVAGTFNYSANVTTNETEVLNSADADLSLPPYVIVSIVLSVSAVLLNIVSMLAIMSSPGRLSTQLRLAFSLTMADVVISFSVLLHTVLRTFSKPTYLASSKPEDRLVSSCVLVFNFALNVSGHLACLLNLVAMGLDHYIAVHKPLQYANIATKRRTVYVIVFFWVMSLLGGYSMFFSALTTYPKVQLFLNYCDAVMHNDYHSEYLVFAVAILSIFAMLFTYISVFREVQRVKRYGTSNKRDRNNRKALWTTLLILGTFILLWLPSCLFQVVLVILVIRDPATVRRHFPTLIRAGQYLYCLMLCNCLADPIIYAIRVRDVQMGYRLMYFKIAITLRKKCGTETDSDGLPAGLVARRRCSRVTIYPPLLNVSTSRKESLCTQTDTGDLCTNV